MNNIKRMTIKIDHLSWGIWIIFLGVFRPEILPDSIKIYFRVICLLFGFLFLVLYMKKRQMINASLIYVIPVILSCWVNYAQERLSFANLLNGIQYALCIYELYCVMFLFICREKRHTILKSICRLSGFYCIVSVFVILLNGNRGVYFLGSKYMTSYMMMFYLGLKYYIEESQIRNDVLVRTQYIVLAILFETVIWYINCMTGFVSVLLMIVLAFIPEKAKKTLSSPLVICGLLVGSLLVLLCITSILEIDFIQYFIRNILHKSLTLTDRLRYYEKALEVFRSGNLWLGYGYASDEMREAIALGTNIQNGLLQELLDYGVIGAVSLIVLVYFCSKYAHNDAVRNWPLYIIVIGFFMSAIVEVSFNRVFFMSLFALRWYGGGSQGIKDSESLVTGD